MNPQKRLNVNLPNNRKSTICTLWEEAIGIKPIGRMSRFYDLGGDSLEAGPCIVEVGQRLWKARSAEIGWWTTQTIEEMARLLDRNHPPEDPFMLRVTARVEWAEPFYISPLRGDRPALLCN